MASPRGCSFRTGGLAYDNKSKCYNLKVGLGCNLGKDLNKDKGDNQLVKYKNTGLYLQLYT